MSIENYQLILLPCHPPITDNLREAYESTYTLWKNVWSKTLKELDGLETLHSDEFTRYDFAAVIFKNNKAVSMFCCNEIDLKLSASLEDSWFSCWPKEVLLAEQERPGLGVIAAWFCTDPKHRKSKNQSTFNLTQVCAEIFSRIVLDNNYNLGYGVTRNNRSVGKYAQNLGSTTIKKAHAHGCEVDLIFLEPSLIAKTTNSYSSESHRLWENRIDYTETNILKQGRGNVRRLQQAA